MKDALSKALSAGPEQANVDRVVDRVLASAFFRHRPLQAGAQATVVRLADARRPSGPRT
jgi:hypothetical protein